MADHNAHDRWDAWDDETTITEGEVAFKHFTDRIEHIRHFVGRVNDDPPGDSVIFFHGDGGNGKSLLLRYLREHCCRRLQPYTWERVKKQPDDDFLNHVVNADHAVAVPVARLDFHRDPHTSFEALLKLRRDLSGYRLHFPLYDFACVWYLKKSNRLTSDYVRSQFPADDIEFALSVMDMVISVGELPVISGLLQLGNRHLSQRIVETMMRRRIDQDALDEIIHLDHESELLDRLPQLFAEDLNANLEREDGPERIVLLFDTHEAFWGNLREQLEGLFAQQRDEWLRSLLRHLDVSAGAVPVVSGRDAPRWDGAQRFRLKTASWDKRGDQPVELHLIGNLTEADGDQYLKRVGIEDPSLRQRLLDIARVKTKEVHPYYIGLCADIVLNAARRERVLTADDFDQVFRADSRNQWLADRLLSYVDDRIASITRALSVCRAFDLAIYQYLADSLDIDVGRSEWKRLIGFSFVHRDAGDEGQVFQIHALLDDALRRQDDDLLLEADAAMERYYRALAERDASAALAEAILHATRQDQARGVTEWTETFETALRRTRFDRCRSLLNVRTAMTVDDPFLQGLLDYLEGEYFQVLSRYDDAQRAYRSAVAAYDRAPDKPYTLSHRGLALAPDDPRIHRHRGLALRGLADLQARLSHPDAEATYRDAVAAFGPALALAPDDPYTHNNRGLALGGLADLRARLAHPDAEATYRSAVDAFDRALGIAPDNPRIQSNRGLVLQNLADLQARLSHPDAEATYRDAVATFDRALGIAPDDPRIHSNFGVALRGLADLQARLEHSDAEATYRNAIAAFDRALGIAPNHVNVLLNKAFAMDRFSDWQVRAGDGSQNVVSTLCEALAMIDRVAIRAPEHRILNGLPDRLRTKLDDLGGTCS